MTWETVGQIVTLVAAGGGVLWAVIKYAVRADLAEAKAQQAEVLGGIRLDLATAMAELKAQYVALDRDIQAVASQAHTHTGTQP